MKTKYILMAMFILAALATPAQVPPLLNYQGRVAVIGTNYTGNGQFKFSLLNNNNSISRSASATAVVSYGFLVNVIVTDGGAGYLTAPSVTAVGGGGSGALLSATISGGVVTSVAVMDAGSGYSGVPAVQFSAPPASYASLWSNDGTSINGSQPAQAVTLGVTNGLYAVLLGDTTLGNMTAMVPSLFTNSDVRLRVWFNDGANGFQQLAPDQRLAGVGYALIAGTVPDGAITAAKIAPNAIGPAQMAAGVSGLLNFQVPTSANVQAALNTGYMFTNAAMNQIVLPPNPNMGDRVRVTGAAGGFTVMANTGQTIISPPGSAWTALGVGQNNWTCLASSADGSKLIAGQYGSMPSYGSSLSISTNYGVTWSTNNNAGSGDWVCVASSADGSKLVAAQGGYMFGPLFTSTNYGVTWSTNNNAGSGDWRCVASSADGTKLVAAQNMGMIYTSTNSGVTWSTNNNAGLGQWQCVASSADGSKLVAGQNLGMIYTSANYGVTWSTNNNGGSGPWQCVASSADGSKLVAGQNGPMGASLFTSTNYGVTWSTNNNAGSGYWKAVASSADGSKLAAVQGSSMGGIGTTTGIYTSTDFGVTWSYTAAVLGNWSSIASSSDGNNLVAAQFLQTTGSNTGYIYAYQANRSWWRLFGSAFANLELIYAGGGLWSPVSYSGTFSIQ